MTATQTTVNPRPAGMPGRHPRARVLLLGLAVAMLSASMFGTAGAVGKSLLLQGWTPGAAVTARVALGALVLAAPAAVAMRGRWHLLRRPVTWIHTGLFGLVAVAGCQLFYFLAVERLSVGVALMLEYLGPILVVGWLWARRGQRPRPLTIGGVALAVVGLLLVLDVLGEVQLSAAGVMWGLLAAVGLAVFFVIGADDASGLPPTAFAAMGMTIGAVALALAGLLGVVPMAVSTSDVLLAGVDAPWWVPVLWLGLVAAAGAYLTGIVAARMLGAKVSSFVGLAEVMFAVLFAWLLLGEMPAAIQLLGGVLIVAGVAAIKADERDDELPAATYEVEPLPEVDARSTLSRDVI
ncbi:EamA family transporter [Serinicoccus profundi]|uniref:EamA family transporter n=1 Tax=Serinicoccus profundi TaxID=1078471 RepID=UPI000255E249|nr:DMT family transporter [Serinicoccus profundi]